MAALICKLLNIPTIFIPHGAIGEGYITVIPKDCDIFILNSEIEKEFLLDNKLNPKIYANRLIPVGNLYFKKENSSKIHKIIDIFDNKKVFDLNNYNYKILLALNYDYLSTVKPFINFKIINEFIKILKTDKYRNKILLIIKLHPTDNIENYRSFFQKNEEANIVLVHKQDIRSIILSVDIFFTPPSTTILEGILFKTPTIMMTYNYYPTEILYKDEKYIRAVDNYDQIEETLDIFFNNNEFRKKYIDKAYNYGLKFCKNYDKINDEKRIFSEIYEIIHKLTKKESV